MLFTASPAYTQKCSQETKLSLPAPEILLAGAETVLCSVRRQGQAGGCSGIVTAPCYHLNNVILSTAGAG